MPKRARGDSAAPARAKAAAPAEESADIDRILKEKGKGATKQYMCSWMDGAEPQWVDAKYLKGTVALEEWEEACEVVPEVFDSEEELARKCALLAEWWRSSQRTAILVGAGISASVLPTFRGQGGLWTKSAAPTAKKGSGVSPRPVPTQSHVMLSMLEKAGRLNFVASQNYDDLFRDFPKSKLSELHGNIFTETCRSCGEVYHRDFEVRYSRTLLPPYSSIHLFLIAPLVDSFYFLIQNARRWSFPIPKTTKPVASAPSAVARCSTTSSTLAKRCLGTLSQWRMPSSLELT